MKRRHLARFGEQLAADFLRRRGAVVIAANHVVGTGEIDLLVRIAGELTAVEVKTRRHHEPRESFTADKAAQVRRLAGRLSPPVYRVDYVGVEVGPDGVAVRWVPMAG